MNGYVTAKRAAEECGVSRRRINQLLQQGRIKGAVKLGKQWVMPMPVVVLPPMSTADSVEVLEFPATAPTVSTQ